MSKEIKTFADQIVWLLDNEPHNWARETNIWTRYSSGDFVVSVSNYGALVFIKNNTIKNYDLGFFDKLKVNRAVNKWRKGKTTNSKQPIEGLTP